MKNELGAFEIQKLKEEFISSTSVTSKSGRKSLPPNYSPTLSHNAPTQTDPSSAPEILEISNGRFGKFVEEWSKFT